MEMVPAGCLIDRNFDILPNRVFVFPIVTVDKRIFFIVEGHIVDIVWANRVPHHQLDKGLCRNAALGQGLPIHIRGGLPRCNAGQMRWALRGNPPLCHRDTAIAAKAAAAIAPLLLRCPFNEVVPVAPILGAEADKIAL